MADPITLPPDLPTRKQAGFSDKFSAWLTWFTGTFITQLIAIVKAFNFNATNSVSTTSLSIGTGAKSLTVDDEKSYLPGQTVKIARTSDGTKWMVGDVTAYNSTTGAIEVTVSKVQGSGTFTDWTITLAATEQIDELFVNDQTEVTAATGDAVLIADASDSGKKKKTLISSILALIANASETVRGIVELATAAEYQTGTDADRVPSVKVLRENSWVYGSSVATTSGDPIVVLSSIPSWATEVELILDAVSLSGTDLPLIQAATGAAYNGTTYQSSSSYITGTLSTGTNTDGLLIQVSGATITVSGVMRLVKANGDVWRGNFSGDASTGAMVVGSGKVTLAGALGQLRIASSNTFDGGSVIGRYK
jgi:hypothetical protein